MTSQTRLLEGAPRSSARQPEPPALILNEPSCYHFRVLDPRLPLCWRPQNGHRLRDGRDDVVAPVLGGFQPVHPSALAVMLSKIAAGICFRASAVMPSHSPTSVRNTDYCCNR